MLKACPTSPQHLVYTRQACAVLLTGIGVKLAIYNPFSSPDAPSQRKLFSVSISVCFGLQLVMSLKLLFTFFSNQSQGGGTIQIGFILAIILVLWESVMVFK